jgi:hypothetical protein
VKRSEANVFIHLIELFNCTLVQKRVGIQKYSLSFIVELYYLENAIRKFFLDFFRLVYNGPLLNFVRVFAAFHCQPLNNFTKIKLSQQTTKPRIEFEQLLQIGRKR